MATIKRTKGDRTHYAAAVSPAGVVTKWVADRAQAVAFDGDLLAAAKAHAAKKAADPNLGTIVFEGEKPVEPVKVEPVKAADPAPKK